MKRTSNVSGRFAARLLAVSLALVMILLPGSAGAAMTWENFLSSAAAVNTGGGNCVLDGRSMVGGDLDDQGRLIIEGGADLTGTISISGAFIPISNLTSLTLKNLAFSSTLALANTAFILDNITVDTSQSQTPADGVTLSGGGDYDVSLTVNANSEITATGIGINAGHTGSGDLSINILSAVDPANPDNTLRASVTGGKDGISAEHTGTSTGDIAITVEGDVEGRGGQGIYAGVIGDFNSNLSTNTGGITVITGAGSTVTGSQNGILAAHAGTGDIAIMVDGDVEGQGGHGINTNVQGDIINDVITDTGDITVTTGAGSTVTGSLNGIRAGQGGTGDTAVSASGTVTGTTGNGIFAELTRDTAGTLQIITQETAAVNGSAAAGTGDGAGINAQSAGGTIIIANIGETGGIDAAHTGAAGSVSINNTGTVTGDGINATVIGTDTNPANGGINIINIGTVASGDIDAGITYGNGDILIFNAQTGTIVDGGVNAGITNGNGNLVVQNLGGITGGGIDAGITDGNGTLNVGNAGTIDAQGNGITAQSNSTGTFIVENGGQINATGGNGIEALQDNPAGAPLLVQNVGDITATGGTGVVASGNGVVAVSVNNTGAITGDTGVQLTNTGAGNSVLLNVGAITGTAGPGAEIQHNAGTVLVLPGNGTIQGGAYTDQNGRVNTPTDLLHRVITAQDAPALTEAELLLLAQAAGLVDANGNVWINSGQGVLVLEGQNADGTNYSVMQRPLQPDPEPDPVPDPQPEQEQQITVNADFYLNQPKPEPPRPTFRGISYSDKWLMQAFVGGASRDLRAYAQTKDGDGLPEKARHSEFTEALSDAPDGSIMLTLTVRTKQDGSPLVVLSMHALEVLLRQDVTFLTVLNYKDGTVADIYPLAEIYAALVASGHADCQEIWLAGMDADAVIVDASGNKTAL